MPHYRTTVESPWTTEQAFGYLSDLAHFADWDPGVKRSVQTRGTGPARGAAFAVTVGGVGRDLVLPYEIVGFDPFERVEVRAETAALRSVDVMTFAATAAGGCLVTYDADLTLRGLLRVGSPVLGLVFGRIGDRAAGGLRRVLQGTAV